MALNITFSEIIIDPLSLSIGAGAGLVIGALLVFFRVMALEKQKAALKAQISSEQNAFEQQQNTLKELELKSQTLSNQINASRENSIRLEAERESLQKQTHQHKEDLQNMEEIFTRRFENLSNRIFDEKSEKFKKQSQESIGELVNPLKEKIADFQKKVDDSFSDQAKEQYSLKEQIKNIVDANEKMTLQAESLASAIKGDSKTQGDWGEIMLEKILEESGLRKDQDYVLQASGLGLRHPDENGRLQKPDVVVYLPEDKHMIIDSKMTLTHYERFYTEADDAMRPAHLKNFVRSVREKVKELEDRRYQDTDKLGTPDFVLMFMPIEGAYMLALQEDRELQEHAWNKNVIIVGPTNLFATLKTIASLWRLVRQNQNALEIAKQGGALYDKIDGFVSDMKKLGDRIKSVEGTYNDALNKLSTGQGNILRRTEKLKQLGAKTSKSLPANMVNPESFDEEDDDRAS